MVIQTGPDCSLSEAEFSHIAGLIHRESGILITPAKKSMLVSRLSRRLRQLGLAGFGEYIEILRDEGRQDERNALLSAVTTNVTGFFREPHHFAEIARMAPDLAARARAGARIRIWSAGCSTGQEAFSIAATLLSAAPELATLDLRILATDIDPAVIETARAGLFDRTLIGDPVPEGLARFLVAGQGRDQVAIASALRDLIRFEVLNLIEPWPFTGRFDIIFCRNVVIYFDAATRHDLWSRFAERMPQGGTLFIGHSERLDPRLGNLFVPSGITQYRRTDVPAGRQIETQAHASRKAGPCP